MSRFGHGGMNDGCKPMIDKLSIIGPIANILRRQISKEDSLCQAFLRPILQRSEKRGRKGRTMTVTKHKQASEAAFCPPTVSHRPRQKKISQQASEQAVGFKTSAQWRWGRRLSGDPRRMSLPGVLKDRGLIGLLLLPESVENACPHVSQSSDCNGMALSLSSFALIILFGPGFLLGTLPGKLLQGIAPGLDAAQPTMRFLVRPALEEDRRGARQGLQAACALIARAVIAHLSQQTRSETRSSPWQALEQFAVGMDQKKALNLLVVLSNLLDKRFQLVNQGQHQARFGACDDLTGLQTRLLELLSQLLSSLACSWIPGLFEQGRHL